jgi:transposase
MARDRRCHPQTVRERLQAFNERGLDGLGRKPGSGRKPRLTPRERSTVLALAKLPPPGKAIYERTGESAAPDPKAEPEWTLDTLAAAARERGIQVARSQVRRMFRQEGTRWRRTRLWATRKDPDFAPQGPGSSRAPPHRLKARRSSVSTSSAR